MIKTYPFFSALTAFFLSSPAWADFLDSANENAKTVAPEQAALSPVQRGFLKNFEIDHDITVINLLLVFVVVILGFCLARATTILNRGGYKQQYTVFESTLSLSVTISTFSLLIGSFFVTSWYWPILAFVTASVVSGLAINHKSASIIARISIPCGLTGLAISAYLLREFFVHY